MMFYRKKKIYYSLSELVGSQGFVVSLDRGTYRGFLSFESTDEFCRWYSSLRPEERTLNEVVTSDVRKLVLDIDGPDDEELPKFFMYDWPRHVTARVHEVFQLLDIGTPEVIAYDMCSDSRISYHLVVSNFAFSAQTCRGLCAIISQGQIWSRFVDHGVYKSTQFMRLEGSTKFGERRWKMRVEKVPPRSFTNGLLSDLRETRTSDVSCNVIRRGLLLDERRFANLENVRDFEVRNTCGDVVFLRRTQPGFCSQCHRTHDKENAMIRYDMYGRPTFLCWRFFYRAK